MGELIPGASLEKKFWEDDYRPYSVADILRGAGWFGQFLEGLAPRSLVVLENFPPLHTWMIMLSAWARDLSVLPLPPGSPIPDIPYSLILHGQNNQIEVTKTHTVYSHAPDLYILTSGSTGTPKAIGHTLKGLMASARSTLSFYGFEPGDSWLLSLDPSHIGGFQILLRMWIAGGVVKYFGEPKDVARALKTLEIDFLSLVPTQLFLLIQEGYAPRLAKLKAILLGGAKTQLSLLQKARDLQIPVSITYGSSETASQISAFQPGAFPDDERDVGEPLSVWSIQGEEGSLSIEGEALFLGYFQAGIWHKTPDRFSLPDRGFLEGKNLWIEGRADEVFQVGGENVAPAEILSVLEPVANLSSLVIMTQEDSKFGQIPILVIRSRTEPHLTPFHEHLAKLKPIKRPREIWWFESDEVGKISKARLQILMNEAHSSLRRLWIYEKL